MKVVNSSHKNTKEVNRLVRWTADYSGASHLLGTVLVCDMTEAHGFHLDGEDKSIVLIQLGRDQSFPYTYRYPGLKTAPQYTLRNWKEHLVSTVAHESTHALESKLKRRHSEIRAEYMAIAVLEAYRARTKAS
jgi:hypothetical protein